MSPWRIDTATFALFVHAWRTVRLGQSMRQVHGQSGISLAAFARAEAQQRVSAANVLALCLWMEANPYWFLIDPQTGKRVVSPPGVPVSRGTPSETRCDDTAFRPDGGRAS